VRTYYKELVQRTRRERRRGYHAAAGSGQPPPPPGTLKQARLQAVQGTLQGELGTAVRWLGWGETSNVCEILLNAVSSEPRALTPNPEPQPSPSPQRPTPNPEPRTLTR